MTAALIAGGGGRLGRAIAGRLRRDFPELRVEAPDHAALDAADAKAVRAAVETLRPAIVFNAAGFTDVGGAAARWGAACRANAEAPAALASASSSARAYFVHFSTDYVFSGAGGAPWREADPAEPQGAYGKSKRLGEEAVLRAFAEGLSGVIVRAGWLYGSGDAREFPARVLERALAGEALWMRTDQVGKPTSYAALAELSARLAARRLQAEDSGARLQGLLHFAQPGPYASRFELARFILERGAAHAGALGSEAAASALQSAAARLRGGPLAEDKSHPANCRLCSGKLEKLSLTPSYSWKDDVDNFVENFLRRRLSTRTNPSLTSPSP